MVATFLRDAASGKVGSLAVGADRMWRLKWNGWSNAQCRTNQSVAAFGPLVPQAPRQYLTLVCALPVAVPSSLKWPASIPCRCNKAIELRAVRFANARCSSRVAIGEFVSRVVVVLNRRRLLRTIYHWHPRRMARSTILVEISPPLKATACLMVLESWRMLPGHGCATSMSMASGESAFILAVALRKVFDEVRNQQRMSSRSRKAGSFQRDHRR